MPVVNRKPRLDRRWRAALPDHVAALAWSPDDRHVAAAVATGPVAVLDAGTGAVRHLLPGHGFAATSVAWADAGTVASAGQDGRVRLWDVATGAERRSLDAGARWVERVAVSPCGTDLASAAGKKVRLWGRDGRLLRGCGACEAEDQRWVVLKAGGFADRVDVAACGHCPTPWLSIGSAANVPALLKGGWREARHGS